MGEQSIMQVPTPPPAPDVWHMQFTPRPACVRLARTQVGRVLTAWGVHPEAFETVLLIITELATNAIQHAKVPGRLFEVKVAVDCSGTCTIEVSDPTKGLLLHTNPLSEDEFGRGLQLVRALADDFDVRDRVVGKTVRAVLACCREQRGD